MDCKSRFEKENNGQTNEIFQTDVSVRYNKARFILYLKNLKRYVTLVKKKCVKNFAPSNC